MKRTDPGTLLCVANYPSNTGFAWDFIESLYAGLADRLAPHGVGTLVAYPVVESPPRTLEGSAAEALELEVAFGRPSAIRELMGVVRRRNVRTLYLSDRAVWHPAYSPLRAAGVRTIVVHDHTSGGRTRPSGGKRLLKRWRQHLPGSLADRVIAVSDYVARRKQEVDLVPPGRVVRVWNSVVIPEEPSLETRRRIRSAFELHEDALIVGCAARASGVKGIDHLFRAFNRVCGEWIGEALPHLLYMGDGPMLDDLRRLRASLSHGNRIVMPGYVPGAADVLGAVDVAVAPSVWQEAFGLAALEPMARGVPVVASAVGGIPEVVRDGREGVLVRPGDEAGLMDALHKLLAHPEDRVRMGRSGRRRAVEHFARERQMVELTNIFVEELGVDKARSPVPPRSGEGDR